MRTKALSAFTVVRYAISPTLSIETTMDGNDVRITWEAGDAASGLDTCTLEVREGEGAWQQLSTACVGSATHPGEPGHLYTVRLTASDNVGNEVSTEAQAGAPRVTKYYYHGGQRVAMRAADVVYYLHADHLGSTSLTTDASGAVAAELRYYPYGETRHTSGDTPTTFHFTGQREDATIGLYFYNARYYDPHLGRFISADTVVPEPGNPQDLNRYAYVRNNPLRYTDPSGHAADPGGGGGVPWPPPQDPLTNAQWEISKRAANTFGLPAELVAGTVAVEIVDDTDRLDAPLDFWLQALPLAYHYGKCSYAYTEGCLVTDGFLSGYEHYFGLLGSRGPGNGVANVHIATAKDTEEYFATHYPDQHLLDAPPDIYARSAILLSDEGNIRYAAARLRMIADYRTGVRGPHLNDLNDLDMQMIYGRFRCRCWERWADFASATTIPEASRGWVLAPYLQLYRGR